MVPSRRGRHVERMVKALVRVALLVFAVTLGLGAGGCTGATSDVEPPRADVADDRAEVTQRLARWSNDFAAHDTAAVCDLFAPDVVLTYPGVPDLDHDAMCARFAQLFEESQATGKTFRYAPPAISDVLPSGDLVVVRLVWTLTVRDASGATLETVREQGIDVFERQPDRSWRIRVSHAFPMGA